MKYRVFQGCPKCGGKSLRQITREHAERLTGETIVEGEKKKYFQCRKEDCLHVFSRAPAELMMDKKKEAG